MSSTALSWAWWHVHGLTPSEKLLLVALADRADDDGVCWPGQASLAKKTGISERNLRRVSSRLAEKGVIEIEHRPGDGSGRKTNVYRLMMGQPDNMAGWGNRPKKGGQPDNGVRSYVSNTTSDEQIPPYPPQVQPSTAQPSQAPASSNYLSLKTAIGTAGWPIAKINTASVVAMCRDWAAQGVLPSHVSDAIEIAKQATGGELPQTPAYLRPIVAQLIRPQPQQEGGSHGRKGNRGPGGRRLGVAEQACESARRYFEQFGEEDAERAVDGERLA